MGLISEQFYISYKSASDRVRGIMDSKEIPKLAHEYFALNPNSPSSIPEIIVTFCLFVFGDITEADLRGRLANVESALTQLQALKKDPLSPQPIPKYPPSKSAGFLSTATKITSKIELAKVWPAALIPAVIIVYAVASDYKGGTEEKFEVTHLLDMFLAFPIMFWITGATLFFLYRTMDSEKWGHKTSAFILYTMIAVMFYHSYLFLDEGPIVAEKWRNDMRADVMEGDFLNFWGNDNESENLSKLLEWEYGKVNIGYRAQFKSGQNKDYMVQVHKNGRWVILHPGDYNVDASNFRYRHLHKDSRGKPFEILKVQ